MRQGLRNCRHFSVSAARSIILILLVSIAAACAPATPLPPTATLQGAFVPTRIPRSATPTATETPTAIPTATAVPSATPAPTDTPTIQPTDTPSLTPTLTPTEDVNATATADAALLQTIEANRNATATSVFATAEARVVATAEARVAATATAITALTAAAPTVTPSSLSGVTPEANPLTPEATDSADVTFVATGYNQFPITSTLMLDTPVTGLISYPQVMQLYRFTGELNQVIDLEMATSSGDLLPALIVVDPKGREVARFEDRVDVVSSAAIRGLTLPEAGDYIIAASRLAGVFGLTEGTYSLTVRSSLDEQQPLGTFSQPIVYDEIIASRIDATNEMSVYTFRGSVGDRLNITMTRSSDNLDPTLFLTDNIGNVLAWNDDDLRVGSTDSAIAEFVLPTSGYYSLVATRYFGGEPTAGDFRIKITPQEAAAPGVRFAALDPINSRTIRTDGRFFSNFSTGDSMADVEELRTQALVTFQLPTPVVPVVSATLRMQPCLEVRGGFGALGELTVYSDLYGVLSVRRDYTRVSTGSRILSTQTTCDALDVTDYVQELYDTNRPFAQFRYVFRQSPINGQGDEVMFTPSLVVDFGG